MVSISACHAEHLGSIPSRDVVFSIKCDIFTLILCGGLDCIVVSTSVCGTESSGSNPARAPSFRPWSILKVGKTYLFFFFLYVRNALAHGVNVSTGFPLFQHPKVVSSILPCLHTFFYVWYCACVVLCACALRRGPFFSPTCLTWLLRLHI